MSRFTLMVEESYVSIDGGIEVTGDLFGEPEIGEQVYVQVPGHVPVTGNVFSVTEIEKIAKRVRVKMVISNMPMNAEISKFTVVTNIVPSKDASDADLVENSMILGLSYGFLKNIEDPDFQNIIMHEIVAGSYLTKVFFQEDKMTDNPNLSTNPGVGFIALPLPTDKTKKVLPLYTDMEALKLMPKSPEVKDEGNVMLARFEEAYAIMRNRNYHAVVINPFGPAALFVPSSMMDNLHVIVLKMQAAMEEEKKAAEEKKDE